MAACDICYNLDLGRLSMRVLPHYDTSKPNQLRMGFEALDASLIRGCGICSVLRQGVECFRPEYAMMYEDYSHVSLALEIKDRSLHGLIKVMGTVVVEIEFFAKRGSNCPYPAFGPGAPLMVDPESPECYEMVRNSIDKCIKTHSSCQTRHSAQSVPKRLLDLGAVTGSGVTTDPATVKLFETNGKVVSYAALSHCWGKEPLLKTTQATLNSSEAAPEFKWCSLPKSFQDAAKVARHLGLRYLWVDSLCIIQDDPHDWEEEAAKMGSIYEGSHVTIAATSTAGSTLGFLSQRQDPHKLVGAGPDGSQFSVFVRKYIGEDDHEWLLLPNYARTDGKEVRPLLERGWCFQERIMASRVLHYTDREVVLECNEGYRCECDAMENITPHSLKLLQSRMFDPDLFEMDDSTREVLAKVVGIDKEWARELNEAFAAEDASLRYAQGWSFFAQRYSETKLTYQKDILPALSALANRMQQATSCTYLAGLWKQHVPHCFLWISYNYDNSAYRASGTKGSAAIRRAPYIAPSFSWASRVGKIRWWRVEKTAKQEVKILGADCKPRGSNPLGEVSDGFIKLRGRMITVVNLEGPYGAPQTCKQLATGEWEYLEGYSISGCVWDTREDYEDSLQYRRHSYLLPIFSTGGSVGRTIALILRPSGESPGVYRRVGLARDCGLSAFDDAEDMDVTIV